MACIRAASCFASRHLQVRGRSDIEALLIAAKDVPFPEYLSDLNLVTSVLLRRMLLHHLSTRFKINYLLKAIRLHGCGIMLIRSLSIRKKTYLLSKVWEYGLATSHLKS